MAENNSRNISRKSNLERIASIKKKAKDILVRKAKSALPNKNDVLKNVIKISAISALPIPMSAINSPQQEKDVLALNQENKIENIQGFEKKDTIKVYESIEDFNKEKADIKNQMQTQIDSAFESHIQERQQAFYDGVYDRLTDNITTIKKKTPKGGRAPASVLREVYGNGINTRFYCAYASISAMNQAAKETGCAEFSYMNDCITNIHYCPSVVSGLKGNMDLKDFDQKIDGYVNGVQNTEETKNLTTFLNAVKKCVHKTPTTRSCQDIASYLESLSNDTLSAEDRGRLFVGAKKALGVESLKALDAEKIDAQGLSLLQECSATLNKPREVVETSNLLAEMRSQLDINPNSVFLIVHRSQGNRTGSGLHAVVAMRNKENPDKVTVFSQNGEHIVDAEKYFVGMKNSGTLANICERGSQDFRNNEYTNFAQNFIENKINDNVLFASENWEQIRNEQMSELQKDNKTFDMGLLVRNQISLNNTK